MSAPNGGNPSPFAARTRAPFPNAPGAPGGNPPPGAPASAPAAGKKSFLPLAIGAAVLAVAGGAAWFFSRGGAPETKIAETPLKSPAAEAKPPVAAETVSVKKHDARADYEALAARAATLSLGAPERAVLAAATLQAAGGGYDGAAAALGPVVAARIDALYDEAAVALHGIKLEEHAAAPEAQKLRLALVSADAAAKSGDWAGAVARRDEAIVLVPAAQAEVAVRLVEVAKEALARGDIDLATYFYERVLRLAPAQAEARTHLFAHKFKAGQTLRAPSGIELAYVPPGEFIRGSRVAEPGRSPDEEQAKVRLTAGFFLGVTEVTQRQWDLVFGAGAAARVLAGARAGKETAGPELPMHSVRWDEARTFCEKLSALDGRRYRLPTEAEWEYACRAGTTTAFNLGDNGLSAREANIDDGSAAARFALAPAGTVGRANAWGLRDMHGNVWEWCADWSAPYPAGDLVDPRGPADTASGRADLAMKVVRGGGWNAPASDARSANRWEYSPAVATSYIGLRVALEPDLTAP